MRLMPVHELEQSLGRLCVEFPYEAKTRLQLGLAVAGIQQLSS